MLIELQSLLARWNKTASLTGDGGGGDDGDGDEEKPKDPFDNFDFNRFISSRRRSNNPPPSNSNDKDKDKKDKDKDKAGTPKEPPATTSRRDADEEEADVIDEVPRNTRPADFAGFRSVQGGRGGLGGNSNFNVQVQMPQLPRLSRRGIIFIILGLVIVALFLIVPRILGFWADLMWFDEVKQTGVLWTRTLVPLLVFAIGFVIAFVIIMVNVSVARRFGPTGPVIQASSDNPLAALIGGGVRFLNIAFVLAAIFISLILAGAASGEWQTILFYLNAAPWTAKETIFNNQIGFYIYDVPLFSFLHGWLTGLFVVTLIGSMLIYFLRYALSGRSFAFTPAIKTHASVLGAIILGLFAIGYQLNTWKLVYSTRGRVFGVSATDMDAQVPANLILTVIVAGAAILLVVNIFIRDTRRGLALLVAAAAIWLVSLILVGGVYPSIYQNFSIKPNELTKEQPYITNTINMTRQGFGLEVGKDVKVVDFPGTAQLSQADIQKNPYIQQNARLWDYSKLQSIYDTTETLRKYYDFKDIDIDRYNLSLNGGQPQQTQIMIAGGS